MKFAIALLIASTSAVKLTQKDAPPPLDVNVAFAGVFSDAPVAAGFVQLADDEKKPAAAPAKEEKKEAAKEAAPAKEAAKEAAPAGEEKKAAAKEEKKEEAKEEKKADAPKAAAKGDKVVEKKEEDKTPAEEAKDKAGALKKMKEDHAEDMKSVAATWAGSGAPPKLSAGDIATMAAPAAGFDASLQPPAVDAAPAAEAAAAEAPAAEAPAAEAPAAALAQTNMNMQAEVVSYADAEEMKAGDCTCEDDICTKEGDTTGWTGTTCD